MKIKGMFNEVLRKFLPSPNMNPDCKNRNIAPFITFSKCGLYKNQLSMPKKQQRTSAKRRYARISLKKRKLLVRMVTEQDETIANAIKKLNLKLTTARLILQKYKETGTFPMRKFKKVGKMLLDLQETPVKEEYMDQESISEGRFQLQDVKVQFQSERELGYLLKIEANCEHSSNDSSLFTEKREAPLK